MFAGHIGVALGIARMDRRVNVGVFVAAALWLDLLLWLFILLGWESVSIPADYATTHQPEFAFPYSHGFVAALLWSTMAGALALRWHSRLDAGRTRLAALVAAAVSSHWLLDALVHRPEMPIAGAASTRVGLGLWNQLPLALAAEGALVVLGLALFLRGSRLAPGKSIAIGVLSVLILAFTVVGMTVAPPPPSATAMAAGSGATLAVVCSLYCWLGRPSRPLS